MPTGHAGADAHILEDLFDHAVESACRGGTPAGLTRDDTRKLFEHYYRHVPTEELKDREPEDVAGACLSHYRLAAQRPQGTASVRAFTPTVEEHGWTAGGHSVVEIVTDDMPFLVDSVTAFLSQSGHPFDLVIHPQILVERDVAGNLRSVHGVAEPDAEPDSHELLRESWMHVEIDRVPAEEKLRGIERGLNHILRDVRVSVEDWPKMHAQARTIVDELGKSDLPVAEEEGREAEELLTWLADNRFTFLGYREYSLTTDDEGMEMLRAIPGTGLGILRFDQEMSASFGRLPAPVRAKAREKRLLIITKANSRSTVHRPVYLDYIGLKTFDENGEVDGERRFIGLFTSAAYTESVTRIPVLRRKAEAVMKGLGYEPMSHSGKALMDFLETYPRDELFQTPLDQLIGIADQVLKLEGRRRLRLFVRRDDYGRFLSCIVYLPRDRYTTKVRLRMQVILVSAIGGEPAVDFTARVSESVLARLHFVVRPSRGHVVPEVDVAALEQRIADATRTWEDDLTRAADEMLGEAEAVRLLDFYYDAFPEAYKEDFPARNAIADLLRIESVDADDGIALQLYYPPGAPAGEGRLKIFRRGEPLALTQVLPMFTALGVEVVDERPYAITPAGEPRPTAWVYDFGLRYGGEIRDETRQLFQDGFMACWRGQAEADGFNRLIMAASLTWREAALLRAYAKYLRQAGIPFSRAYIEASLLANVPITRMLVALFEARFDPETPGPEADAEGRVAAVEAIEEQVVKALDDVESLDQDRILRFYLALIRATLRTNYFQATAGDRTTPYYSFKLDPERIDDLPQPRPKYEIFVYSPRVEGVHLRFGAVARGGLRWSDRAEDFRTEVLGLVKAQMVKNAVIVPVGAKGGFYCKLLPDPAEGREAWLEEGIACYKTFISGLLDVTDNLVSGETVPPPRVVRYDGDDIYLVVAADKGTAKFSDIANEVAMDYGFWLGDAFASGGSAGYDHKAMGITARGAWVSVQRHFREMGIDCQREDFTCVGVGDMSGDVFGNGMLLSEHTRLIAAFDHRHIFVDPDPQAAPSYAERQRLYELPRSSWADYDQSLISEGGGVYERTLKSIPITPQMRSALGISDEVEKVTPAQLLTAILKAPVDLLWNGGIGTYVKASKETHAEVGDKANDAIRVDGAELRCRCIGEGGNLGLTQLGRIEYARAGGRVNSDFIDNSAGVDCSDHEVNIKILLDRVVADGDLTGKQRNKLLTAMTDEVAALVLDDNYRQNVALANGEDQAPALMHVHADWIKRLVKMGKLDRDLEFLPSPKDFAQRLSDGEGLSAPELSVLLAYTKIVLTESLLESDLADDPLLRDRLYSYFPSVMQQDFREQIGQHPLRRQIVVTQIVNGLVNGAGVTFYHRLSGETGAQADELARAYTIAQEIFGTRDLITEISGLDNQIDAQVQTQMRLAVRTLAERVTRWLVNNRRHTDATEAVDYFDPMAKQVAGNLSDLLVGRELVALQKRAADLEADGVSAALALQVASMPPAYMALNIVDIAQAEGLDLMDVARVHFTLGDRLGLDHLTQRILALPRDDRWRTMARATLRDDLHAVHAQLTSRVLATTADDGTPADRIDEWAATEGAVLERSMATLEEIWSDDTPDLARLSVGLRVVRSLLSG
jgi:glutamate dehydrogenase